MKGEFNPKEFLGERPQAIFVKEYRNLSQQQREAKAAINAAWNNPNCWWIEQYMRGNPNRIKPKKDKIWLTSL
tara:strand:- start:4853 stop:5071 length:219 start_codon:yes stop_codon:yes gene_type:complete